MSEETLTEAVQEFQEKYYYLVWYARKEPPDHPYWNEIPSETTPAVFACNRNGKSNVTYTELAQMIG